jgi:hypothetical protein
MLFSTNTVLCLALLTITFELHLVALDNEDLGVRENAQVEIEKLVMKEMFVSHVKKETKDNKSLEARRRLRKVLSRYYSVSPTTWEKTPWIDCIPDLEERDKARAKYLRWGGTLPEYEGYRYATSQYIKDKMENEGWTRTKAIKFLDSMVPEEIEQMKRNPSAYPEYAPKKDSNK